MKESQSEILESASVGFIGMDPGTIQSEGK